MTEFISGLDLNEQFFHEVVRPLLAVHFPDLPYAAARLGSGSDVLGFDDDMSTDHDWGIRQQLFLREADHVWAATAVAETLAHHLPYRYRGYSVHFGPEDGEGTRLLTDIQQGPVSHRLEVVTVRGFFTGQLGLDPTRVWDAVDWLTVAQQQLLQVTAGRVFADDQGKLSELRHQLAYYPTDIWLYLLACQWARIGQEDHFVGRTGFCGDDLGSRLLAARLVHDVMMLGFLYEKQYAPYPKWFGTAFARLSCAGALGPILQCVLTAAAWPARENHLCHAFQIIGEVHNRLTITPSLATGCQPFHGRPFRTHAGGYAAAVRAAIQDEQIRQLPLFGSLDQFSDNTDLRSYPPYGRRLRPLYQT